MATILNFHLVTQFLKGTFILPGYSYTIAMEVDTSLIFLVIMFTMWLDDYGEPPWILA